MILPAELEATHYRQTDSANTAEAKEPSLH